MVRAQPPLPWGHTSGWGTRFHTGGPSSRRAVWLTAAAPRHPQISRAPSLRPPLSAGPLAYRRTGTAAGCSGQAAARRPRPTGLALRDGAIRPSPAGWLPADPAWSRKSRPGSCRIRPPPAALLLVLNAALGSRTEEDERLPHDTNSNYEDLAAVRGFGWSVTTNVVFTLLFHCLLSVEHLSLLYI